MDYLPQEMRLSATARGILIAMLMGAYAWVFKQPAASLTWTFLIAAGIQLGVIALRRFMPPDRMPQTLYLFELFADAVTVFMFALGIYGGILKTGADI